MTTNPRTETMPDRPPSPLLPSLLVARIAAKKARQAPSVAAKTAKKARQAPSVATKTAKKARQAPPAAKKTAKKARRAPSVANKTAQKAPTPAPDGELRMPVAVVASILKRFHAPFAMRNGMTSPEDASRLVPSSHEKRKTFAGQVACKLREAKTDL